MSNPMSRHITLPLNDLGCGEAALVERFLTKHPGVVRVYVNPAMEMVYITYDPTRANPGQIAAALLHAGYRVGEPHPVH